MYFTPRSDRLQIIYRKPFLFFDIFQRKKDYANFLFFCTLSESSYFTSSVAFSVSVTDYAIELNSLISKEKLASEPPFFFVQNKIFFDDFFTTTHQDHKCEITNKLLVNIRFP